MRISAPYQSFTRDLFWKKRDVFDHPGRPTMRTDLFPAKHGENFFYRKVSRIEQICHDNACSYAKAFMRDAGYPFLPFVVKYELFLFHDCSPFG
ncbi:MAG: CRISPR-associated protein Cas5 [Alphaproteobacteria bacterium]|nr:MAG: CRISPR-associated protein Cas5 [Alphaproteobacteria bacterium]